MLALQKIGSLMYVLEGIYRYSRCFFVRFNDTYVPKKVQENKRTTKIENVYTVL